MILKSCWLGWEKVWSRWFETEEIRKQNSMWSLKQDGRGSSRITNSMFHIEHSTKTWLAIILWNISQLCFDLWARRQTARWSFELFRHRNKKMWWAGAVAVRLMNKRYGCNNNDLQLLKYFSKQIIIWINLQTKYSN